MDLMIKPFINIEINWLTIKLVFYNNINVYIYIWKNINYIKKNFYKYIFLINIRYNFTENGLLKCCISSLIIFLSLSPNLLTIK